MLMSGMMIAVVMASVIHGLSADVEKSEEPKWYLSVGGGALKFEADEVLKDGGVITLRLGYDYSDMWTFEGVLHIAPYLKENIIGHEWIDKNGVAHREKLSRLDPWGLRGIDHTYAVGCAVDVLFHFTRWERLDPYLALGVGATIYGEDLSSENKWPPPDITKDYDYGGRLDASFRAGGGVMYHFNDEWAVRVDGRTFLASGGNRGNEANAIIDAGVVWTFGAHVPRDIVVKTGPRDSDGDGLLDTEEMTIGTDPYDPDTDKDELTDGQEVRTYHTDPLNPDTDYDFLKDGAEVFNHKTNPLKQDTDNGGVIDGHEVLEDNTNPLDPKDDLVLYTLHIEFDTDKSDIKPEYFQQINVIGKVLKRNPNATAVIEGHADKRKTSEARYNKRLSEKRAEAVLDYLVKYGIEKKRMKAVGYGFTRQIAPNDPINGNPKNRRVEVYIKGVTKEQAAAATADEAEVKTSSQPEKKAKTETRPEDK